MPDFLTKNHLKFGITRQSSQIIQKTNKKRRLRWFRNISGSLKMKSQGLQLDGLLEGKESMVELKPLGEKIKSKE